MKIFRLHFEDQGQDFLTWDVDVETTKVVGCAPFQASIWCGNTVVNIDDVVLGLTDKVEFETFDFEQLTLKYPVVEVEALEV